MNAPRVDPERRAIAVCLRRTGAQGRQGGSCSPRPAFPGAQPALKKGREQGPLKSERDVRGVMPNGRSERIELVLIRNRFQALARYALRSSSTRLPTRRGEKCARRAVPLVAEDLNRLAGVRGRTQLARAQHIGGPAPRRTDRRTCRSSPVLADLGLRLCVLRRWSGRPLRRPVRVSGLHPGMHSERPGANRDDSHPLQPRLVRPRLCVSYLAAVKLRAELEIKGAFARG